MIDRVVRRNRFGLERGIEGGDSGQERMWAVFGFNGVSLLERFGLLSELIQAYKGYKGLKPPEYKVTLVSDPHPPQLWTLLPRYMAFRVREKTLSSPPP